MNPHFNGFTRAIDVCVPDSSLRSKIIAAAVARGVSDLSSLPSSEVESPVSHFNMTVLPEMRNLISQFNENTVFDCKLAIELARSFWMIRYSTAHPSTRPLYTTTYGFFDCASLVELYVSPEQYCFLNENKTSIYSLASIVMEIVKTLRS